MYAITIDGPAGSGKSTLAKNIQKKLKAFILLDTGAFYRWTAKLCLDNDIDINKKSAVYKHVKDKLDLEFLPYPRGHKYYSAKIYANGELINKKIYGSRKVTDATPIVAAYPRIRNLVKKKVRQIAKKNNIVIAGRDIGTEVLPQADAKIFLDPSVESRARRRYRDEIKQGKTISLANLKTSIAERDSHDKEREHGPLKKPAGALAIDNTYYTASQTLKEALKFIEKKIPDVYDLEPVKLTAPTKHTLDSTWGVSSASANLGSSSTTTESAKDLKKRLKEKYKKMAEGGNNSGGGFFSKY